MIKRLIGGGSTRNSNIELYRIIVMLLIIAHHYVVNSGVLSILINDGYNFRSVFLLIFGAFGKTGINCFVLITGYFMCCSNITTKKFLKLILEVYFYRIAIYVIFLFTGYETISLTKMIRLLLPTTQIAQNFTGCFLLFYLLIPFLNILINNMTKKLHMQLLALVGLVYVFFGTIPKLYVTMNYVSWFICLYLIASYLRFYPPNITHKTYAILSLVFFTLSCASVLACFYIKEPYYFVTDSNTLLAVLLALSSFMWFKDFKIKNSKLVNKIAASTFGVLCIHANSDAMRTWLWKDFLNVTSAYQTGNILYHSLVSVFSIFVVCIVIDWFRINTFERFIFSKIRIK